MTEPNGLTNPQRRSAVVLGAFGLPPAVVLGLVVGVVFWWVAGVVVFVVVLAGVAGWGWSRCESRAVSLLGGRPAEPLAQARLINLVEGLCNTAGVPPPTLLVLEDPALNAALSGLRVAHATLVVTSGMLAELSRVELEAVLARQLMAVKTLDMMPLTAGVVAGGIGTARAGEGQGRLSPLRRLTAMACLPARRSLERTERRSDPEGLDRLAVGLTRYPPGLLAALEKMEGKGHTLIRPALATAHLWMLDPLPANGAGWPAVHFGRETVAARLEALKGL
jgi:heat shock protein HtpX